MQRDSVDELSSSDMNESLLHGGRRDGAWHEKRGLSPKSKNRACTVLNIWRSALNTALLVVILVLLLVKLDVHRPVKPAIGGDLAKFAPEFAQQIVTFKPDPGFAPENPEDFFKNETKQKWLDLVPKGLGYVEVGMAYQFDNLPTPLPEFSPNTVFTTSMTHQLHCLYMITHAYSALQTDPSTLDSSTSWHISHCFDYLRQSIMCCGDVALEGASTSFPEDVGGSDGWDAKHVCKDYSQVYTYLSRKRANNEVWI